MTRLSHALAAVLVLGATPAAAQVTSLLNVSYDIGRELFAAVNEAFIPRYEAETGISITIDQSHAGSSAQARAVLEGLQADVVTFNQVMDVQALHDRGDLIPADWADRLPNNSSPYYSLPAFLVHAGNPKNITGWADLAREDVAPVLPNPKTSGNARYTYLAARAWAIEEFDGDEAQIEAYLKQFFANVPVFDTGGRGATTTFAERGIGDVLLTFEAEVIQIAEQLGTDRFEIVVPPMSLLAEFPATVVDKVVDARGSRELATEYLEFLYTPEGQRILANAGNRVHDEAVTAEFADSFPEVRLVTVEDVYGGWPRVMDEHFADGGLLDRVFVPQ